MKQEIWHGDCLELMKNIPDKSIDMILCDLPFGITACKWDFILDINKLWIEYKRILKKNGVVALFGVQPFTSQLILGNLDWFKYTWIWEKNRATNFPNAKRRPLTAHEEISIFINGKLRYNPQKTIGHKPTNSAKGAQQGSIYHGNNIRNYKGGDTTRFPRTVIRFDCERGLHPTQKPVALCEYLIKTYTNENDLVLDNCAGSGSTLVAAKNLNRQFIGIEKEKEYYDICINRLK